MSALDQERVLQLATQIMIRIRANYQRGPTSRDRVYEALNALAYCVALSVRGADPDQALQWFSDALNLALRDLPKNKDS